MTFLLLSMLWLARFLSSKNWASSNFKWPIPVIKYNELSLNVWSQHYLTFIILSYVP